MVSVVCTPLKFQYGRQNIVKKFYNIKKKRFSLTFYKMDEQKTAVEERTALEEATVSFK
jgi:RNase H-fold protein (predicted Holliday junction resolvase)